MDQDRFQNQPDAFKSATDVSKSSQSPRYVFSSTSPDFKEKPFRVGASATPEPGEKLVAEFTNGVETTRKREAETAEARAAKAAGPFATAEDAGKNAAILSKDGRPRFVLDTGDGSKTPFRVDLQRSVTSPGSETPGETTVAEYRSGKKYDPEAKPSA